MLSPLLFIKSIIMIPIRTVIDFFDYIFTIVIPFIGTLLVSFPLNVIVIASIALITIMYIFSEPFVWVMLIIWELNRLYINIQIFAMNAVTQFGYDWLAGTWNDVIEFILLVIEFTWNGICGGADSFEEIIDCTGFDNFLIVIEIITTTFHQYFIIIFLIFQLIFAALQDALCVDMDCTNICENPGCTGWTESPIYSDDGFLLTRPGPLGVNWENYLGPQDILMAQAVANVFISALQWLIGDVLPFWVQISAFMADIYKLFLLYYAWVAQWVISGLAKIFGKLSFIFIRAFYTVFGDDAVDNAIIFDPLYYIQNITDFAERKQNTIKDNFINNYLNDYTELFLMMPDLPGNKNVTNTLIDIYFTVKRILDIVFEVPLAILQAVDKIICSVVNIIPCISIGFSDLCDAMFIPPVDCIVAVPHLKCADYEEEIGENAPCVAGDYVTVGGFVIKDFYSLMSKDDSLETNMGTVQDCKSQITGEYYDDWGFTTRTGSAHPFAVYDRWTGINCIDDHFAGSYTPHPAFNSTYHQIEASYGPSLCGSALDVCSNPYIPAQDGRCSICLSWYLDFTYYGDVLDIWNWLTPTHSNKFYWCADYFRLESGGFLYADPIVFKQVLLFVDDLLGLGLHNFWFDWGGLSRWFHTQCHEVFDPISFLALGNCPCIACEVDQSQILWYLDWIPNYKGFPCNPEHPDPSKSCCVTSPYSSILWVFDKMYEFFNGNLFDECNICPTPLKNNLNETCSVNPACP